MALSGKGEERKEEKKSLPLSFSTWRKKPRGGERKGVQVHRSMGRRNQERSYYSLQRDRG